MPSDLNEKEKYTIAIRRPKKISCRVQIQDLMVDVLYDASGEKSPKVGLLDFPVRTAAGQFGGLLAAAMPKRRRGLEGSLDEHKVLDTCRRVPDTDLCM